MAARGKSGKRRSWFRIITGTLMALVCAVLLYQFWLCLLYTSRCV